jgi:pyrroline-5-carboxylate reductase
VQRIGIIGVGEIGRAVVMGLCDGVDRPPEVFLSPRGARTAAELSARYEGVQVCAGNQEVVEVAPGRGRGGLQRLLRTDGDATR